MRLNLSLQLNNPICIGAAPIDTYHSNCSKVGAIFTKSITLNPREPNSGQIIYDLGNGTMMNRMGLDNSGLEHFITYRLPYLLSIGCPIYVSIADRDNYWDMIKILNNYPIAGIELNLSCPNIPDVYTDLGSYISSALEAAKVPLGIKVSSNTDLLPRSLYWVLNSVKWITAINTVKSIVVVDSIPKMGGLSGKPLKHIALKAVYDLVNRFPEIPIIGCGGISSQQDVMDMLLVGATAVQICTAELLNPGLAGDLCEAG